MRSEMIEFLSSYKFDPNEIRMMPKLATDEEKTSVSSDNYDNKSFKTHSTMK
jgi:hypothetical protein